MRWWGWGAISMLRESGGWYVLDSSSLGLWAFGLGGYGLFSRCRRHASFRFLAALTESLIHRGGGYPTG